MEDSFEKCFCIHSKKNISRMKHAGYCVKYHNRCLPYPGKGHLCTNEWYRLHMVPSGRSSVLFNVKELGQSQRTVEIPWSSAWAVSRQQSWPDPTGRCSFAQEGNGEVKMFRGDLKNIRGYQRGNKHEAQAFLPDNTQHWEESSGSRKDFALM